MKGADDVLLFLAEQKAQPARWGKPISASLSIHAAAMLLLISAWQIDVRPEPEPVKILEINVMGDRDMGMKGTGNDAALGPMPDKVLAKPAPPKAVARGNTRRLSRGLSNKPGPVAPPRLMAQGPLFARSSGAATEDGVGRDKLYMAPAAARGPRRQAGGGGGDGLVGVSGNGPINLKAKRGGGAGSGAGHLLAGGQGSPDGFTDLERKGQSILAEYPSVTKEAISAKESVDMPAPPDAFFSISGPLGRRKILGINLPKYPRWAEENGVEAQISVRLTVSPSGRVNGNVLVEQTSGYPDFDKVALESVRGIRFAPLDVKDMPHEEWGVATFNFRLRRVAQGGLP